MKHFILTLILCGFSLIAKSQSATVEKSIYGIQAGFLGVWVQNEAKLSNSIALRSEIGLTSDLGRTNSRGGVGFLVTPVIRLEPRLYYNLNQRERKSRRIDGNSGNYVSLGASYNPYWFVITNRNEVDETSGISFTATWGIRRSIGEHFTFETGFGIGYWFALEQQPDLLGNGNSLVLNIPLRIGYRF